jgi:hypothetical protein
MKGINVKVTLHAKLKALSDAVFYGKSAAMSQFVFRGHLRKYFLIKTFKGRNLPCGIISCSVQLLLKILAYFVIAATYD